MGWSLKYDLEFKGLKEGLHEFEFNVQDTFFEHFDPGLVDKGDVQVKVTLEKRSLFMKLFFEVDGYVELICDRCLENYRQKLKNNFEMFVKTGENENDDDEIIWISPDEHKISLAQFIYEFIILSIPLKRVHPDRKDGESGCNREMLEKLERLKQRDKNEEATDPRWSALKNWNKKQN